MAKIRSIFEVDTKRTAKTQNLKNICKNLNGIELKFWMNLTNFYGVFTKLRVTPQFTLQLQSIRGKTSH